MEPWILTPLLNPPLIKMGKLSLRERNWVAKGIANRAVFIKSQVSWGLAGLRDRTDIALLQGTIPAVFSMMTPQGRLLIFEHVTCVQWVVGGLKCRLWKNQTGLFNKAQVVRVGTQVSSVVDEAMLGDGREIQPARGREVVFSAEGPEKGLASVVGRKGSS